MRLHSRQFNKCYVPDCEYNAQELPVLSSDPERAKQWLAQIGIPEDVMVGKVMICKLHFDVLMYNKSGLDKMATEAQPDQDQLVPIATSSNYIETEVGSHLSIEQKAEEGVTKNYVVNKKIPKNSPKDKELADDVSKHANDIKKVIDKKCPDLRAQIGLHIVVNTKYSKFYRMYHLALGLPPISEMTKVFDENLVSFHKSTPRNQRILREKVLLMSKLEKKCVVCLTAVNVRLNLFYDVKFDKLYGLSDIEDNAKPELAHLALVLTAQGVFEKWKQLISIGFFHNRNYNSLSNYPGVKLWIRQNIRSMFECGLHVMGLVSDLSISLCCDNPRYFRVHGSNNRILYHIYDVSYLFKRLYFEFFTHDYNIQSNRAKMQHIIDYYAIDNEREVRMTPNLTETHFKVPKNWESVELSHAREVISFETAQAMTKCIESGLITKSAESTVMLINMMCTLYQVIDSDNWNPPDVTQLTGELQKLLLNQVRTFFNNIITNSEAPKEQTLIEHILITVDSVLSLYGDIKSSIELEHFRTKSLSLTDIAPFFNRFRNNGDGAEPTCRELFIACKKALRSDIFKPIRIQNNEFEILDSLNHLKISINLFKRFRKKSDNIIGRHINIKRSDYNTLKLKRRDDIVMIAGFILKKCFDRHKFCEHTNKYIINSEETSPFSKLVKSKDLNDVCLVPPEKFIDFIEMMELKFRSVMSNNGVQELTNNNLVIGLLNLMIKISFQVPCECFPLLFAKKLYLRIRIFHMLKYNNRLIRKGINNFVV